MTKNRGLTRRNALKSSSTASLMIGRGSPQGTSSSRRCDPDGIESVLRVLKTCLSRGYARACVCVCSSARENRRTKNKLSMTPGFTPYLFPSTTLIVDGDDNLGEGTFEVRERCVNAPETHRHASRGRKRNSRGSTASYIAPGRLTHIISYRSIQPKRDCLDARTSRRRLRRPAPSASYHFGPSPSQPLPRTPRTGRACTCRLTMEAKR